jgi:hypothetical protein
MLECGNVASMGKKNERRNRMRRKKVRESRAQSAKGIAQKENAGENS